MNETPFKKELKRQIQKYIRILRDDRTGAMSLENLLQVTPTPRYGLEGEPRGPVEYAQLFREVCESDKRIKAFLL